MEYTGLSAKKYMRIRATILQLSMIFLESTILQLRDNTQVPRFCISKVLPLTTSTSPVRQSLRLALYRSWAFSLCMIRDSQMHVGYTCIVAWHIRRGFTSIYLKIPCNAMHWVCFKLFWSSLFVCARYPWDARERPKLIGSKFALCLTHPQLPHLHL